MILVSVVRIPAIQFKSVTRYESVPAAQSSRSLHESRELPEPAGMPRDVLHHASLNEVKDRGQQSCTDSNTDACHCLLGPTYTLSKHHVPSHRSSASHDTTRIFCFRKASFFRVDRHFGFIICHALLIVVLHINRCHEQLKQVYDCWSPILIPR